MPVDVFGGETMGEDVGKRRMWVPVEIEGSVALRTLYAISMPVIHITLHRIKQLNYPIIGK